ncbi:MULTISPECIES: DNA-binding protein [Raoultella]|uniref:LexA family protein n=1 Tax=Raoultella TaxID=160674 RepID=UPI0015E003D9|nr:MULTISPECIES: DNA-binding protein [Raoultella]MCF6713184.1 DNA-binding protein [Raoultella ornithinolytica]
MAQTIAKPESLKAGGNNDNAGLSSFQKLTPRQQEVFDLLVAFIKKHGYPPTARELSELIGAASPNAAAEHLRALRRKGVITITPNMSRGISIVGHKEPSLAVQLLQEMINNDPGARERAVEFIRLYEGQL